MVVVIVVLKGEKWNSGNLVQNIRGKVITGFSIHSFNVCSFLS